jgi:hypothetical protein
MIHQVAVASLFIDKDGLAQFTGKHFCLFVISKAA